MSTFFSYMILGLMHASLWISELAVVRGDVLLQPLEFEKKLCGINLAVNTLKCSFVGRFFVSTPRISTMQGLLLYKLEYLPSCPFSFSQPLFLKRGMERKKKGKLEKYSILYNNHPYIHATMSKGNNLNQTKL